MAAVGEAIEQRRGEPGVVVEHRRPVIWDGHTFLSADAGVGEI
jgi:hypothetical protein